MKAHLKSNIRLRIAKRYVTALFSVAQNTNVLDLVAEDLQALANLLATSKPFEQLIDDLGLSVSQRGDLLANIFTNKLHPTTLKFLLFINAKNRLNILREVCATFFSQYLEYKEILPVDIHAPYPLTTQQVEGICTKLQQRFQKNIQPNFVTNQEVLGGFKIRSRDLVLDYSIQGQLQRFKRNALRS